MCMSAAGGPRQAQWPGQEADTVQAGSQVTGSASDDPSRGWGLARQAGALPLGAPRLMPWCCWPG